MASRHWWACHCCDGDGDGGPYSGPYSGGGDGPSPPCGCCGSGDTVVITIEDAADDGATSDANLFECPTLPCVPATEFNSYQPRWDELIGESLTLELCYDECGGSCAIKQYKGCVVLPLNYKSNVLVDGDRCPDVDLGVFVSGCVTCVYRPSDGLRLVHVIFGVGTHYECFGGDVDPCTVLGCDCEDVDGTFCTEEDPDCEPWEDTPGPSPLIIGNVLTTLSTCSTGCGGSISFEHTQTGTPDGINAISVNF